MPEEIITTAGELDALPKGTLVHSGDGWGAPCHALKAWGGWCIVGDMQVITSEELMYWESFTVLHRPDQPSRTEAEIKAEALYAPLLDLADGIDRDVQNNHWIHEGDPADLAYAQGLTDVARRIRRMIQRELLPEVAAHAAKEGAA